jgi:hypothetical protein
VTRKVYGVFTVRFLQKYNRTCSWFGIIAAGGENGKTKTLLNVGAKTKWTAQWKYIMPNGEIRTHLDARHLVI